MQAWLKVRIHNLTKFEKNPALRFADHEHRITQDDEGQE